jgi:hypothetical protein
MIPPQDTVRSGEQCPSSSQGRYSRHDWNMSPLSHTDGRRDGLRLNQSETTCFDLLALVVTNYLLDLESFLGTQIWGDDTLLQRSW